MDEYDNYEYDDGGDDGGDYEDITDYGDDYSDNDGYTGDDTGGFNLNPYDEWGVNDGRVIDDVGVDYNDSLENPWFVNPTWYGPGPRGFDYNEAEPGVHVSVRPPGETANVKGMNIPVEDLMRGGHAQYDFPTPDFDPDIDNRSVSDIVNRPSAPNMSPPTPPPPPIDYGVEVPALEERRLANQNEFGDQMGSLPGRIAEGLGGLKGAMQGVYDNLADNARPRPPGDFGPHGAPRPGTTPQFEDPGNPFQGIVDADRAVADSMNNFQENNRKALLGANSAVAGALNGAADSFTAGLNAPGPGAARVRPPSRAKAEPEYGPSLSELSSGDEVQQRGDTPEHDDYPSAKREPEPSPEPEPEPERPAPAAPRQAAPPPPAPPVAQRPAPAAPAAPSAPAAAAPPPPDAPPVAAQSEGAPKPISPEPPALEGVHGNEATHQFAPHIVSASEYVNEHGLPMVRYWTEGGESYDVPSALWFGRKSDDRRERDFAKRIPYRNPSPTPPGYGAGIPSVSEKDPTPRLRKPEDEIDTWDPKDPKAINPPTEPKKSKNAKSKVRRPGSQ